MDLMEKFNGKIIDYVFDNSGVPCALLIKCNNCDETVACMSDAATQSSLTASSMQPEKAQTTT